MALANDLLSQATYLANLDLRKPKQANLRRAVSVAYYALFHLLVADAVQRMSPKTPANLAPRIGRSFAHSEMKQICRTISQSHRSAVLDSMQPGGFSGELRALAETFVELQEQRHIADYDLTVSFARFSVLDTIDLAGVAFKIWKKIRLDDEANVFLDALLFGSRWAK
jgi:uncharacterized protein (UPF0332 family)